MLLIASVTHASYILLCDYDCNCHSSNDFMFHYKHFSFCANYFDASTFETILLYRQSSELT